jgi:hypothetical protein
MASLNKRFVSTSISFWEEFPFFKTVGPFKKFYNSDKTKDKIFSSTVMWSITKICDRDSEVHGLELEEKIELIFTDMLDSIKTTKVKWHIESRDELNSYIKEYENLTKSKLEKALELHENKFVERASYINGLTYEKEADILEKLLANTSKIAIEIEEARKKLMAEKDKGTNKGGVEVSLGDAGII